MSVAVKFGFCKHVLAMMPLSGLIREPVTSAGNRRKFQKPMAAATMSMYEYESDLRSNEHQLSSSKNEARKKFRLVRDLNSPTFISFSAVHIYDFHSFIVIYSSLHGFILNQHNDQLPVSSLAQLVSQRKRVQVLCRPDFFSGRSFTTA